jgi:hypothetical protein
MSKPIPNSDYYHEMADRLHVIMCTIDVHLLQHPVAKLDKKVCESIEKALELLEEAYQEAGSKM